MASGLVSSVVVLIPLVLFASAATAQETGLPPEWKEYMYPSAGFAITLPHDPAPHPDSANKGATVYTVKVGPESGLSIRSKPAPNCGAEVSPAIGKMADKLKKLRSFKMEGHDAWEWEDGPGAYTRIWCGDKAVFSASLSWPPRLSKPLIALRILDSFRGILPSTR
jgi:hypothetical protein